MIIIGQLSSEEEQTEVRFVAQVFAIGERFRNLARNQKKL